MYLFLNSVKTWITLSILSVQPSGASCGWLESRWRKWTPPLYNIELNTSQDHEDKHYKRWWIKNIKNCPKCIACCIFKLHNACYWGSRKMLFNHFTTYIWPLQPPWQPRTLNFCLDHHQGAYPKLQDFVWISIRVLHLYLGVLSKMTCLPIKEPYNP